MNQNEIMKEKNEESKQEPEGGPKAKEGKASITPKNNEPK